MIASKLVAPYVGAWIETDEEKQAYVDNLSHPMWVRGLKLDIAGCSDSDKLSHPMWVRGLKPTLCDIPVDGFKVAPYVGAWIETLRLSSTSNRKEVAPYVGAWIETHRAASSSYPQRSHPMWVRGLKPRCPVRLWS